MVQPEHTRNGLGVLNGLVDYHGDGSRERNKFHFNDFVVLGVGGSERKVSS
jgi:hypothetical protein